MEKLEEILKPTVAKPMAERVEYVRLEACAADGEAYVVRCEAIPARSSLNILRMLPGEVVSMGLKDAAPSVAVDQMPAMVEAFEQLVEAGTALAAPDGGLVRPAFWFDETKPRHELSLNGRHLGLNDLIAMGNTILQLSGYSGGAADGTFPGRKRT
jgi:hypothetical protein